MTSELLIITRHTRQRLAEQVQEMLRHAGRARQWVRALRSLVDGVHFESIVGLPSPTELRAWLGWLSIGLLRVGLQVTFQHLAELMGVQDDPSTNSRQGLALATMQLWRGKGKRPAFSTNRALQ
jgi:hypothetical protein